MTRALAVLLLLGAACATPMTDRVLREPATRPARVELTGTPFHPQERDQCGPAALATVLEWSGLVVEVDALAFEMMTPGRRGSLQSDLVAAARRHGRVAYPVDALAELLDEIAAGHPILMLQNLGLRWIPRWHYAVAVGYDLDRRTLLLRSGSRRRHETALETFEHTWARGGHWAIAVLPPSELPVRVGELEVLTAVAGLERAGRVAEAETGYSTALGRWPRSLGGWIGLGNARYARGDLEGAADAFRRAHDLHPEARAARHNLAEVLRELEQAP